MKTFSIYAAGEFVKTNHILEITNPYSQKVEALTFLADSELLENTIVKAMAAEADMKSLPAWKKYSILMQIATALEARKVEFAEILSLESAKPLRYSLSEIDRAIQTFIVSAEEAKRFPGEVISMDWTAAGMGKKALLEYFPIGLVAGISPFNFPLNLAAHKIAPAIAAGCPIILKPSSSTPLTTLLLAEIIHATELPKAAFSVLPMNRENGNTLVTDERIKLLTFTGSPAVGWKMKNQAGQKKVVLELGGNAGLIITESADLNLAIQKSIIGAFSFSGQICIHTQRIYIHSSLFESFTKAFVEATKKLNVGAPMDEKTDVSAMIDEANAIRVENWVKEAIQDGAILLCGGKRTATIFEPTVLTNTKSEMKVCALEVFGPLVSLEPYNEFQEAMDWVNDTDFGLQAGIFTNKLDEVKRAFSTLDVGGVIINDVPTFRMDHTPYGGIKNSGMGREGVKYAMLDMLEPKLLVY